VLFFVVFFFFEGVLFLFFLSLSLSPSLPLSLSLSPPYLVWPPPLSLSSSQEGGGGRSFSRPVAPPNSYYPVLYRTPLTSPGIGDVTLVDDGRRECFNGLVAVTRSEARSLGCKHLFGSRTSDRESYGESRWLRIWVRMVIYLVTTPCPAPRPRWSRSSRTRCRRTSHCRFRHSPGPSAPPPSRISWRNLPRREVRREIALQAEHSRCACAPRDNHCTEILSPRETVWPNGDRKGLNDVPFRSTASPRYRAIAYSISPTLATILTRYLLLVFFRFVEIHRGSIAVQGVDWIGIC